MLPPGRSLLTYPYRHRFSACAPGEETRGDRIPGRIQAGANPQLFNCRLAEYRIAKAG
jgi:hypothetical protein